MAYDILCLGEVNVDLILSGVDRLPNFGEEVLADAVGMHVGGSTANVAIFASRLGMKVALRARVGKDDFGDFLLAELEKIGVSTELIVRDPELRTGITVSLSGARDRAFVTYLGTIDALTAADADDDLLRQARHVHIGSYFMQQKLRPDVPKVLARAQELGLTTSLDTGYDPYEEWDGGIQEALRYTSVFVPNEVEGPAIAKIEDPRAAARKLSEAGAAIAMKLGAEGSLLVDAKGEHFAPGYSISVVDTTCCGDAFNAGFLTAMLAGKNPRECLRWGNAAGARIAGGSGAAVDRLSVDQIEALVQG